MSKDTMSRREAAAEKIYGLKASELPRTLGEALRMGMMPGACAYEMGYVSRRINPGEQPVRIAGGSRIGQLYVLEPSWVTTRYCERMYLRPAPRA